VLAHTDCTAGSLSSGSIAQPASVGLDLVGSISRCDGNYHVTVAVIVVVVVAGLAKYVCVGVRCVCVCVRARATMMACRIERMMAL
jgi:hypothetical protein